MAGRRLAGVATAILVAWQCISGCSDRPVVHLRMAVPGPDSSLRSDLERHWSAVAGIDPTSLELCDPCERVHLATPEGSLQQLHVSTAPSIPVLREDIAETIVREQLYLGAQESFFTLEFRLREASLVALLGDRDWGDQRGVLVPFREGRPLGYGEPASGWYRLATTSTLEESLRVADELHLTPTVQRVSVEERERALAELRSLVAYTIECGTDSIEDAEALDQLRALLRPEDLENVVCER